MCMLLMGSVKRYKLNVALIQFRFHCPAIDHYLFFLRLLWQTKDLGNLEYFLGIEILHSKKGIN